MAFTMTTEYALRAVAELARCTELISAEELAARTLVPTPYLAKILQQLHAAGIVAPTRGKFGGWKLNPEVAAEMTVYDVVQSVDPICRVKSCPMNLPEHAEQLCPMHATVDEAFAKLETTFKSVRVIDLVDKTAAGDRLVARLDRLKKKPAAPSAKPAAKPKPRGRKPKRAKPA